MLLNFLRICKIILIILLETSLNILLVPSYYEVLSIYHKGINIPQGNILSS